MVKHYSLSYNSNHFYSTLMKKIIRFTFQVIVRIFFWIFRWGKDKVFLANLNNPDLPPGFFGLIIIKIFGIVHTINNYISDIYINYGLKKYSKWCDVHYSKEGRGYFNYEDLNDNEKEKLYGKPKGRIEHFIINYNNIFSYIDGESFLDVGCGRGQNIKVLNGLFPNSLIKGFDVNKDAIDVIKLGTKNIRNISIEYGNLKDKSYLTSFSNEQFDHIVMSHVFSFIINNSKEETRLLRQSIIDELIRVGRKNIFIQDGEAILNIGKPKIVIEQLNRAHYWESIIPYFNKHLESGNITSIYSPESYGLIYNKY